MTDDEFLRIHNKGDRILRDIAQYKDGLDDTRYNEYRVESGNFISARECVYDGTLAALKASGLIK